ncbi:MAG: hypothetical protein KatS3mg024_0353 [Armatimonadota bacterium]|nr:MAG: hypothetical protein KatS3mg024_0353 [Armatimonadota bacterium]
MSKDTGEIRVIKKKKGHDGHHGGAWKVAYADFVTAMMAFFLVMWIVGLSQDIKDAVAGYFSDPIGFMEAVRQGNAPFPLGEGKGAGKEKEPLTSRREADEKERLSEAKETLEHVVLGAPEFKDLKKNVDIQLAEEGLRIDLVDGGESLFFDSASAAVKPETRRLLTRIAGELKSLPNSVVVEGHTDNRRLNRGDSYTNWELSADRANSARRVLEQSGLRPGQIVEVRGYAANRPRPGRKPEDPANRRVSILVVTRGVSKKPSKPSAPAASPAQAPAKAPASHSH